MRSMIVSPTYHLKHWPGAVTESHRRTQSSHHRFPGFWVKIAQIPSLFAWNQSNSAGFNLVISDLQQNKGFIIRFTITSRMQTSCKPITYPWPLVTSFNIMLESHIAAYIIQIQSQHIQKSAIFTYKDIISPETATRYRACYFASYEFIVLKPVS